MSFILIADAGPINWIVVLPPVLGFLGIYLLLPQARRVRPVWGGVLAAAALILGAVFLIHRETILAETILFYAFGGSAIASGVMMITQSNPVHSALSFALVVLSTCGLFLLQAAPFLMAATIIIYAGAIVVTFLFVIMLAQQEGASSADQRSREPFLASLAGCVLLASLVCILQKSYDPRDFDAVLPELIALSDAKDADEVKRLLGDPDKTKIGEFTRPLVAQLKKQFGEGPISQESDNLQQHWVRKDTKALLATAKSLRTAVESQRIQHGSLALYNVPGKDPTPGKLPAENVAALGRTLYTDYLIPVELAGVLLLAATIGAIVIAGRRTEELR